MKFKTTAFANSFAITGAILFIVCRLVVNLFPELMLLVAQSWLHGLQVSGFWNLTVSVFLLGLISFTATAWITGYLMAMVYNRLSK